MENINQRGLVDAAMNAMNAATKSGDDLQKQYVTAAIDALNILLTSEITPRLASKIARFKVVLTDYAKTVTPEKPAMDGGAKDANGNDVTDVYTV